METRPSVDVLFDDHIGGASPQVLLVSGCPRAGKTEFAYGMLLRGLHEFGDAHAMMTVQGRTVADRLGNRVIRVIGATSEVRPVTTLSALAFRIIEDERRADGRSSPRLLNGAEQDALLRRIMAGHIRHAAAGDECAVCMMLRDYFASDDWARTVSDGDMGERTSQGESTTFAAIERGVSTAFIGQLRDMLARINELGASFASEERLIALLRNHPDDTARLELQWRLAFALRHEYVDAIERTYPGEYRLDASRLLVEAALLLGGTDGAVEPDATTGTACSLETDGSPEMDDLAEPDGLAEPDDFDNPSHRHGDATSASGRDDVGVKGSSVPALVVVDDFQDTTLAGLRFLEALHAAGSRLVLVGNPDEAVQTFRGSCPEYLFHQAQRGPLQAVPIRLDRDETEPTPSYRDVVAARVSLSIPSPEAEDLPLARRPGKMPLFDGALPITTMREDCPIPSDGTVRTALYRSPREELDDVVWQIKRSHLDGRTEWNDMAVIAHDNATVRTFGERLRRDGVPVRYSSVTRPLKSEPFVQGLFALIELAGLRRRGVATRRSLASIARYVRDRVATLMECPLVTTGSRPGEGRPGRLATIEAAMRALESLADIVTSASEHADDSVADSGDSVFDLDGPVKKADEPAKETQDGGGTRLAAVMGQWRRLRDRMSRMHASCEGYAVDADSAHGRDADSGSPTVGSTVVNSAAVGSAADGSSAAEVLVPIDFPVVGSAAVTGSHRDTGHAGTGHADAEYVDAGHTATSVPSEAATSPAIAATPQPDIHIDDHLVDTTANVGDDLPFGVDALYVMLALDDADAPADDVLDLIGAVLGPDPQRRAFVRVWSLVHDVSHGLERLTSAEPQQVLSVAWQACGVAEPWQRAALGNTDEGRTANDRLDVAMRLFQFAETGAGGHDVESFMAQVRSMEMEADSLAHVGPVEQAVTLTTPAGAAGQGFRQVWLPAVQQDVWPNLAERNTLFGGEDLADVILRGGLRDDSANGHDARLSSVLSSEKKGLLVALTRAEETVHLSATWNDDLTPSDFLYGYLPERFPRNRDQARFAVPGGAAGEGRPDGLNGLDADPRGLVAAARARLIRATADDDADDAAAEEAAATLALLTRAGVASADPDNWNFLQPAVTGQIEPGNVAAREHIAEAAEPPVVTLSPSAVDDIWGCPVCWLLEKRFAGPQAGSVDAGFGTLIHAVAQQGSEEGLDRPDFMSEKGFETRLEAVTAGLRAIYDALRVDPGNIDDSAQRYAALRKDAIADEVLGNIAWYFVASNTPDYLEGNGKQFSIGTLRQTACEREFAARFDLDDILAAYRKVPDAGDPDRDELAAIMGTLVGGWPDGMSDDLTIRLSGRIDRMETRVLDDGAEIVRLIDYKTGEVPPGKQIANDLQLVCYQLGLAFPESETADTPGTAPSPLIAQSALFHVADRRTPAHSYAPEGLFQPPLFVDGTLNPEGFTPRYYCQRPDKILDIPELSAQAPEGVRGQVWERFLGLRGTQAVWALTMIARVFYAAAASRSTTLQAHPTPAHVKRCRMTRVCPACAGRIDTVIETRQP